jgi:NAD+ diphosphatase
MDGVQPAVLVIVRHGGRVLLARHRYYRTDVPVLISGMVEPGESAEQAAVREVAEETGLAVILDGFLGTYPYETDDRRRLLMIAMLATASSSKIVLGHELTDAGWYGFDDLPAWPSEWPINGVFADYRRVVQAMQGVERDS